MNCLQCGGRKTDGRRFCSPAHYVAFKDGNERRVPEGTSTFVRQGKNSKELAFCL